MPARTDWPATTLGTMKSAAKIAEPQPPKTSQNVPEKLRAEALNHGG